MQFRSITADAFGPLQENVLELAPGMNVFIGANESGKSSWHAAFYAALCGRRRGPGNRSFDRQFHSRHKPWHQDLWSVGCSVVLADGTELDIGHDLLNHEKCHVDDSITGRILTAGVTIEGCPDGSRFLGLNRDLMWSTLFVRQAEILAVLEGSDQLQEPLQRAADMGREDATATKALERLSDYLKNQIGTDRAPTKPLMQTRQDKASVEADLEEAMRERFKLDESYVELGVLDEQVHAADRELSMLRAWAAYGQLDELDRRVERIQANAAHFPDMNPPPRPGDIDEAILRAETSIAFWNEQSDMPVLPEGPSAAELRRQIDDLPEPPTADTEPVEEARLAYDAYRDARKAFERSQKPIEADPIANLSSLTTPTELRDLATQIESAENIPQRRTSNARWLAIAGISALAAGAATLAAGSTSVGMILLAAGALMLTGGAIPWIIRREIADFRSLPDPSRAIRRASELGLDPTVSSLRIQATKLERELGDDSRHHYEELETNHDRATRQLLQTLESRGITAAPGEGPDVAFQRYQRECRARREEAALAARRPDLETQLRLQEQAEEQSRQALEAQVRAGAMIREASVALGLAADGPTAEMADLLSEALAEKLSERSSQNEKWQSWLALQTLLDGRTLPEWIDDRDRARRQLAELGGKPEGEQTSNLEEKIESAEAHQKNLTTERDKLLGAIRAKEENATDVALLEEQHSDVCRNLEQLERRKRVVEETVGLLEKAQSSIYATVAPTLKASIEQRLPRITQGRYTEAAVDPTNLEIRVKTSQGSWQPAGNLSHGTAEQIYLLLRIALAEHLITNGEPAFLVLDDVTVQSDEPRTKAILDLLHELSSERQIILFTQETDVAEWAQHHLTGPRDHVEELDVLA